MKGRSLNFIGAVTLLAVSLLLTFGNAQAESSDDLQLWLVPTITTPISEDRQFSLYLEAQPRLGDDLSKVERLILRSALIYNYSKDLSFWVGYGWTPTFINSQYEDRFTDEQRVWQQIMYSQDLLEYRINHRLREEQRFIEGFPQVSHRFRYLIRASRPFDDKKFGLTGYNELFFNLSSIEPGPDAGFDRDRFFFGPYWVDGIFRYEVGYVGEYARRFRTGEGRMVNALALAISINF